MTMADETVADETVADELAIRNVLARIARYADSGNLDDYAALFTEDARWEMPPQAAKQGRAEIRAAGERRRADGAAGPGSHTRHLIGTIAVTVDGDEAVAESYWQFYVGTDTRPELRSMGAYRDTFRRDPATRTWRLSHRRITTG